MTWVFASLLAFGCNAPPPTDDPVLYLRAATQAPIQAHETCGQIRDTKLRDECRHANAERAWRAGDGDLVAGFCADMQDGPGPWTKDCWYLATIGGKLTGEPAVATCRRSGELFGHCIFDALRREARLMDTDLTHSGREQTAWHALRQRIDWYADQDIPWYYGSFPGPIVDESDARSKAATELLLRAMAARLEPRGQRPPHASELSTDVCGQTTPEFCSWVYLYATYRWVTMKGQPTISAVAEICSSDAPLSVVADAGGISWTEQTTPIAKAAWTAWCPVFSETGDWSATMKEVFGRQVFGGLKPFAPTVLSNPP